MSFSISTFPEILARMEANLALEIDNIDFNEAAVFLIVCETFSFELADAHVQIQRLLDLFGFDNLKGDDLDRRVLDFGTLFYQSLKRRAPQTSLTSVIVSDGALVVTTTLAANAAAGNTTFTVKAGTGAGMPTSGSVVIDTGLSNQESVIYTRSGDVLTVIPKPGDPPGLQKSHFILSSVRLVSTQSYLAANAAAGSVTLQLVAGTGSGWKTSGTVIIKRGTVSEQKVAFTRTGDILSLANPGTLSNLVIGDIVIQATVGFDRTVPINSVCYAPATEASIQVDFIVRDSTGILRDGDYESDLINVESEKVGSDTRVGSNQISRWKVAPFQNATVRNPFSATRGRDLEDDEKYKQRIRDFRQSLTRATPLAIVTLITGLQDPDTGQIVDFAQLVEPIVPGIGTLYVTDGTTTFSLTRVVFIGRDILINDAVNGDRRARLSKTAPYDVVQSPTPQRTPRLFINVSGIKGIATSVGANFLEDSSQTLTVNAFANMYLKTADGQFFKILSNTAIRFVLDGGGVVPSLAQYAVFDFSTTPLNPGVDYQFNPSTGDLELTTALTEHDALVAASDNAMLSVGAYTYTTGLGATIQRAINGDPVLLDIYPGLRAAGVQIIVAAPTIISPKITVQLTPKQGYSKVQLEPLVLQRAQSYVNSLGIGRSGLIILSEIIRVCKNLPGLTGEGDVRIIDPPQNIPMAEGQMPRMLDTDFMLV